MSPWHWACLSEYPLCTRRARTPRERRDLEIGPLLRKNVKFLVRLLHVHCPLRKMDVLTICEYDWGDNVGELGVRAYTEKASHTRTDA